MDLSLTIEELVREFEQLILTSGKLFPQSLGTIY